MRAAPCKCVRVVYARAFTAADATAFVNGPARYCSEAPLQNLARPPAKIAAHRRSNLLRSSTCTVWGCRRSEISPGKLHVLLWLGGGMRRSTRVWGMCTLSARQGLMQSPCSSGHPRAESILPICSCPEHVTPGLVGSPRFRAARPALLPQHPPRICHGCEAVHSNMPAS